MSAHGSGRIVVSSDPKGHFIEGIGPTGAAFYPGYLLQIDGTLPAVDGRPQYKLWTYDADGNHGEIIVVRENILLGGTELTAYAAGSRFLGYIPVHGDEFKVMFTDPSGTGTSGGQADVLQGAKLIPDSGTGKVIPTTGTPEIEPFYAMEELQDVLADTLINVRLGM